MSADRLAQLADFFDALSQRIPKENAPTQPWQDEVIEAVRECYDPKTDGLTALLQRLVPIAKTASFKGALRTVLERAGRYSTVHNPEIAAALSEITLTLLEIQTQAAPRLSPNQQRLLDFVSDYEFRTGKPCPILELVRLGPASEEPALRNALAALEQARLIELGGFARNDISITTAGVLASGNAARWEGLGRKLLAYLSGRLEAEAGDFTQYTWKELRSAGVAASDSEFAAVYRLIILFALSASANAQLGPPSTGGWQVPGMLLDLRGVRTLEELHALLVKKGMRKPRDAPARTPSRHKLLDDIGALAHLLAARNRKRKAGTSVMFNSEELARTLGWTPERFNEVMNLLARRGWIDVDPTLGSHPFDARGFQLTAEGILTFEQAVLDGDAPPEEDRHLTDGKADKTKVFIIHGRNVAARNAMEQYVRSLGLDPLEFDRVAADLGGTAFIGDIVREGLKQAHSIIALFTPDEYAALRPALRGGLGKAGDHLRWQSRSNVIFEAGMAYGTAPTRTVLVTLGGETELFSDVSGIHIVRLDNTVNTRQQLRQKLIGMGCAVVERADAWADPSRSGDFDSCVRALERPRDPFEIRTRLNSKLPISVVAVAVAAGFGAYLFARVSASTRPSAAASEHDAALSGSPSSKAVPSPSPGPSMDALVDRECGVVKEFTVATSAGVRRHVWKDIHWADTGSNGWLCGAITQGSAQGAVGRGILLTTTNGGELWAQARFERVGAGTFQWGPKAIWEGRDAGTKVPRQYTWDDVGPIDAMLFYQRPGDSITSHGWLAAWTGVYRSRDAGRTWLRTTPGPDHRDGYAFHNALAGIEAGAEIYASGWQGIAHWSSVPTAKPPQDGWELEYPTYTHQVLDIVATGGSEGRHVLAVTPDQAGETGRGVILQLVRETGKWKQVPLAGLGIEPGQHLRGLTANDTTAFAVGDGGIIVRGTRQPGTDWTWTRLRTHVSASFVSVAHSRSGVFVVASDGMVLRSADRGGTWCSVKVPRDGKGTRNLHRVRILGDSAWVVGEGFVGSIALDAN